MNTRIVLFALLIVVQALDWGTAWSQESSAKQSAKSRSIAAAALRDYYRAVERRRPNAIPSRDTQLIAASRELLRQLDSAAALSPTDEYITTITGYHYATAGRLTDGAEFLRPKCEKSASWTCAAVFGFVRHHQMRFRDAEELFARALQQMSTSQRCLWEDLSYIINQASFAAYYRAIPCVDRSGLNERIWWLSSPLWMTHGNDRRTEHYSRWLAAELVRIESEILRWRQFRTDVVTEAVSALLRNGNLHWYGGMNAGCNSQNIGPIFCELWQDGYAFEDRFLVRRGAVEDPFRITAFDYALAPIVSGMFYTANADTPTPGWSRDLPIGYRHMVGEAYAPRYGRVHLVTEAQTGFLLLGDSARLLASFDPRSATARGCDRSLSGLCPHSETSAALRSGPLEVALVFSDPAGATLSISTGSIRDSARGRLSLLTALDSGIISVEARSAGTHLPPAAARHRFAAFRPDAGLVTALKMSDLFLFDLTDGVMPKSHTELLGRMRSGLTVGKEERVGIYWELYGLQEGDRPGFELSVARIDTSAGLVARVIRRIMRTAGPSRVITSWSAGPVAARDIGQFSRTTFSVQLTLGTLDAGDYSMEIVVNNGDSKVVRSSRNIRVR